MYINLIIYNLVVVYFNKNNYNYIFKSFNNFLISKIILNLIYKIYVSGKFS